YRKLPKSNFIYKTATIKIYKPGRRRDFTQRKFV
ncbi:unnamed protein product, partial [marine sediment metagenome]